MSGPSFIDNRDGNTFAKAIGRHLKGLREAGESPEALCIATGYFNAAGWLRVTAEAERLGKVRLLHRCRTSTRHGDKSTPAR